jgi:hypothetical protein
MTLDHTVSFSFPMGHKIIILYLHMKPFLFGYLKRNLMGYRAENLSDPLVRGQVILRGIPGDTLVGFFLE